MAKKLNICFTSDMHGYIMPVDYVTGKKAPAGLASIAGKFTHDDETLIIDGGDSIQGSPFITGMLRIGVDKPHPVAKAMNLAGYQYVTIGNHDLNNGIDYLRNYLQSLNAVCVCANISAKDGLLPVIPWTIHVMKSGLRVGITGACTDFVKVWEKEETLEQLNVNDPVEALKGAYAGMKGKCDVTVCIYHGGFERDVATGKKLTDLKENRAYEIAEEIGFDILLTGHQHVPLEHAKIGKTVCCQPGDKARHFIRLEAVMDQEKCTTSSSIVYPDGSEFDPIVRELAPLEEKVQRWLDTPVGHLDQDLLPGDNLSNAMQGCPLANLVNEMQTELTGADLSATAVSNDFPGISKDVTVRGVLTAYCYANTLYVLEITGKKLREYMERSASYFDCDGGNVSISEEFLYPKQAHYNYDYFYGVDYVFDLSKPPYHRVKSMKSHGHEIADDEKLTICVNSYRHSGTGGYDMLKDLPVVRDIQQDISDMLVEYIEKKRQIAINPHRFVSVVLP